MGLNLEAHYQGLQVIVGLMVVECAKFDKYNDWPMFRVQSLCPMVA
jgi:hypothetical protein